MYALTLGVFACLAAFVAASGHGGAVVSGPSGVVTSHGAIGPVGHGIGVVGGYGYGVHSAAVVAPVAHAAVVGPVSHGSVVGPVSHTVVSGPVVGHGLGYGIGHGVVAAPLAGYGIGHGVAVGRHDGVVAIGHHGVTVQGPPTVPAVVAGPSGKIVADGLWGPTSHWAHGGHGVHGW